MEENSTSSFTKIITTNEEEEDPRILATSYIMYKVGEYYFWFTITHEVYKMFSKLTALKCNGK